MLRFMIFGLCFFLFSSYLFATDLSNNNLIAVGSYKNFNTDTLPWLVMSNDQGKTWDYFAKKPPTLINGKLGSVSCNSDLCVATGNQAAIDENKLVAISNDPSRKIWSYISIKPTHFTDNSDEIGADCNAHFCAIATSYFNNDKRNVPFISLSNDKGLTWIKPDMTSKLPEDFDSIYHFDSISCTNNMCAAAGDYMTKNGGNKILIAISTDQGMSWSFHTEECPDEAGVFSKVLIKCNDSFCVSSAAYPGAFGSRNFILTSDDKGISWKSVTVPDNLSSPISQIDCHNNTCILTGLTENDKYLPFFAVTHDKGKSWSFPTVKNIPINNLSGMGSVSSTEHNIIAGGFIVNDLFIFTPALAISHDNGTTWSYEPAIKPLNSIAGMIINVSCHGNLCMATGFYATLGGPILPYLIISYDEGVTWSFIHAKLPYDLYEGILGYAFSGPMLKKDEIFSEFKKRICFKT